MNGLLFKPYFTKDEYEYVYVPRDVKITDSDGNIIFEQKNVLAPPHWSDQAVTIMASKYFNGKLNSPERETSVEQVINRIVNTITTWGVEDGYFNSDHDATVFRAELYHMLYFQMGAFNSPVWFNLGVEEKCNISACYINSVEDDMSSIMSLASLEARIFKGGSGSGVNLSSLRGSNEGLSRGGYSSGPISFMKGLDSFAGIIKSGGVKRRAAALRALDIDHPDILEFIQCKVKEEKKAKDLISLGYDSSIDGDAYSSIFFQNANNAVVISDKFMHAVESNDDWHLINRVDGEIADTVKARDLLMEIAKSSYECGDPGIQFSDTINRMNTIDEPIRSSNPCFTGDMKLLTENGFMKFEDLVDNKSLKIVNRNGHIVNSKVWYSGNKKVVEIFFKNDLIAPIRCTLDHKFMLNDQTIYEAKDLKNCRLYPYINNRVIDNTDDFFQGYNITTEDQLIDWADTICGFVAANGFINKDRELAIRNSNRDLLVLLHNILRNKYGIRSYFSEDLGVTRWKHVLMISGFLELKKFSEKIGFHAIKHKEFFEKWFIRRSPRVTLVQELGMEPVYDFSEPETNWGIVNGVLVHNCGEFLFKNNSSCNLASLNLLKFFNYSESSECLDFMNAVRTFIVAQDILIDRSSYPSEEIAENSKKYRPLGLGYTNLGAFIMQRGLAYDSKEARDLASSITSLLTVSAYKTSSALARVKGKNENIPNIIDVIDDHIQNLAALRDSSFPDHYDLWQDLNEDILEYGVRNAQVTLAAPTGTISFIMDADSTGIEPLFALVKNKALVGGGSIKTISSSVDETLKVLGYDNSTQIRIHDYIEEFGNVDGCVHLKDEHRNIFDCAVGNGRCLSVNAHIDMLTAIQPFLSGGISKTVNIPSNYTIEDIYNLYIKAWYKGLKSIIIYRDGSKAIQPLTTISKSNKEVSIVPHTTKDQLRLSLPSERSAITHKFSIAGHEGYLTVGLYDNGAPGELFIKMAKVGSVISGLVDSVALVTSMALQYGVPLKALVDKFEHTRFEPSGFTGNPDVPFAKSIVDYIFRWLGHKFLSSESNEIDEEDDDSDIYPNLGTKFDAKYDDTNICLNCGEIMRRSGTCYYCDNCGESSGCS